MRHCWPEDTRFTRVVLEVEDKVCAVCGGALHICDHRRHRIFTLQGPVEVVCKLAHCSDRQCAARAKTRSPYAETTLTQPWWLIGWDVFCWVGHRRFARHWSVPQIRGELADTSQIPLSADAIEDALQRYQTMRAARQQDPQVAAAYRNVEALVLSIDGLQPEKGHETLSVVRELNAKRLWFAEALLSSNGDEVRRLLSQARAWAMQLGLPVHLWLSDKHDAFVTGIAAEFPGVPHRYGANHFMRDLAKPMLETESHAKVKRRSKVRGLRAIEREVLQQRQLLVAEAPVVAPVPVPPPPTNPLAQDVPVAPAPPTDAGEVVLDYCSAVRGILNDDQGGPLQPPSLRMAEALGDVRASLQRNLDAHRGGRAHTQLQRLAGCIDRGVAEVQAAHHVVRQQRQESERVAATLTCANGSATERQAQFTRLQEEFAGLDTPFYHHVAGVMASFAAGLFVGADTRPDLQDNLALERWFRKPKGHERRIHGHRHAGVRIVQEGPTLLLALDAHLAHPGPFTGADLRPYRHCPAPACQRQALHRRTMMRQARSTKQRPGLLAELERRYLKGS